MGNTSEWKWSDKQKAHFRKKMIERYGSEEAWKESQAARRRGKKRKIES